MKLLTWLKSPSSKTFEDDPIVSASSGKKTLFKTQLAITIHGLVRNKELVELLHKLGLFISYNDTIDLESAWAYHENQVSKRYPKELAYGYPGTVVIDNDGFKEDALISSYEHDVGSTSQI